MLYMHYPRCGDCTFSGSFVRECTAFSSVAGEGVELTVHKESVVVEEIKEVEQRNLVVRNLFMTEIIIEFGYSHAIVHLADFP